MWVEGVNISALLPWVIGALLLMLAVRGRPAGALRKGSPAFPNLGLVDWMSGLLIMLALAVLGTAASATWFLFPSITRFVLYVLGATAIAFIPAGIFWLLFKLIAGRAAAREAGR
jgi:hypothetical protein